MGTEREVKAALPTHIPYYSFHGDRVSFNATGCSTPGKNFLEPKEILVRVYNSTIANQGGFSGEVIAIGDFVDSVGVNDYVFGGGLPSLQKYITIRAEDVCTKPRDLSFADASRLHAATLLLEHLRHLQPEAMVLILGDMTGFAAQICQERGCFVTSSEDFGCGEHNIIDNDNFLEWLETHDFIFDIVIDATGDLDVYDHCHKFTTKRAEYISINPDTTLQALKSSLLPSMFGGGTRKLTIARPTKGAKKAALLSELSHKVLDGTFEVKNPRIVAYRSVSGVAPVQRYVTAVNVIEQKDITPEDPEYHLKEERTPDKKSKDKGKAKRTPHRANSRDNRTPDHSQTRSAASANSSKLFSNPTSPIMHPYSPKISSRLAHSISASNLETSPTESYFPAPAQPDFESARVTEPETSLLSPERRASPAPGSPKIPIVARPPTSRRQSTDVMYDTAPFEQIELQSMASSRPTQPARDEQSSEESIDAIIAAPIPKRVPYDESSDVEDEDEGDDSDTEGQTSLLRSHIRDERRSLQPPVALVRNNSTESDGDVSEVDMNEADLKAADLQKAQEQIAALQRQVEMLMASQAAVKPAAAATPLIE